MKNFKAKTKEELRSEIERLQKILESDHDNKSIDSTAGAGTRSSESAKAEEKLRESEERFRGIVENTDAGYFFIDSKGIIREVNDAWVRMYKYDSADEIVGKHFTVIQKIYDVEKAEEVVNGILKGRAEFLTGEFSRKCKDNSIGYHSFSARPVQQRGEVIGIEGFIIDITERMKMEETLIKDRKFTDVILNSQLDTFFVFEAATGKAIRWNKSFSDISGYSNKEIDVLKVPDAYYSPEDLKKSAAFIELVFREGKGRIELSLICKDGHTVPTEYEVSVLKGEQGKPQYLVSVGRDITEWKKSQEALLESERLLKRAQEIAHIGHFKFNPKTSAVEGSDELFAIFGLTQEEFQFSDFIESVHPDDREFDTRTIGSSIENGIGYQIEHRLLLRNGTLKYVKVTGEPVIGADGTTSLLIGTVQDITDLKTAEKALVESKELAEKYLNVAGNIILALDPNGIITLLNKKGHEIMGYKDGELIGKNWIDLFIPKEKLEETKSVHKKNVKKEDKFFEYFENELITRNGEKIFVSWYNVIVKDDSGNIIGTLSSEEDITKRKKAEEALQKSEAKYRILFNEMLDGFALHEMIFDKSGKPVDYRFLDINPAFEQMTGLTAERVIGKTVMEVIPETESYWIEIYGKVTITGEPIRFKNYSDAIKKHFEITAFRPREGQFACIFIDITEKKQMEEQLRQSEKMGAIGRLAGGIAHDFNNQLGGLLGYAELLREKVGHDADLTRYADNIIISVKRSSDLTAQLLAFSRQGKYQEITVNIHNILHEVINMLQHSMDKRIVIKQHLNANPPTTTGDPTQLQNAILNLALNARNAMPRGGELLFSTDVVQVDESYKKEHLFEITKGAYIKICIADTGIGMNKETQQHIFEPFFTTKEKGKGTGMGLAAVYGTVKNHNGTINIYSKPGKGTTFSIYLPLNIKEEFKDDEDLQSASTVKGSAHLLLVEDEEMIRAVETELLEILGYKVSACSNGAEAVKFYKKSWKQVDLVIIDMVMPEMNGKDAFIAMREINPDIIALLASGYSLNGEARIILEEGVKGFLQIPFRKNELLQKIV